MRKIIEEDGKFYTEETAIGAEVTLESLGTRLAQARSDKEFALEQEAQRHDGRIAEIEADLEALKKIHELKTKPKAKSRKKAGKSITTP